MSSEFSIFLKSDTRIFTQSISACGEHADIAAAAYIEQGFGDVNVFKREFTNYVHNLHNVSTVGCWDTECLARLGC